MPNVGESDPCLVFVCQRGEIELKASLLAASLRRRLGRAVDLVALVPRIPGQQLRPTTPTLRLMDRLGVRVEEIDNRLLAAAGEERPGDLMTNKIYCLTVPTTAERLIVLDSDILCLRPFDVGELPADPELLAKPVDLQTERRWSALYRLFGLALPEERLASSESGELGPPYFNSGFLVANLRIAGSLADLWLDSFAQISASDLMADNLHFREQAALAIAIRRGAFEVGLLPRALNYPVHLTSLEGADLPFLAHYHWPEVARREEPLRRQVQSLCAEHPELVELASRHRSWHAVVEDSDLVTRPVGVS